MILMAGMNRNPAGPMCSKGEVDAAFGAPGPAGKDVEAAGRVASVGGMKSEAGTRGNGGAGPAKG